MMTNMRELQGVFILLGLNIKLCPKLSCAKFAGPPESESKDNQCIKKNSTVAKMSLSNGKFTQSSLLKEFNKKIRKNLKYVNFNVEESCDVMEL